jgi:hypothetical protein
MTDERSLIFAAFDQRSSETRLVTSGPARLWKREEVLVADWVLSPSSETWLFADGCRKEGEERGCVGDGTRARSKRTLELGVM